MALFGKANPVPSVDLLDPIEPVNLDRLETRAERSSVMTEIKTIEPEREKSNGRRPIPGLVLAGAVFTATIGLVFIMVNREPDVAASPVEIAEAFLEARIIHDAEAMSTLLAEDAVLVDDQLLDAGQTSPDVVAKDVLPGLVELERITGRTYTFESCVEDSPAQARCTVVLETDESRALGVDPFNAHFLFHISEGKIDEVVFVWNGERTYAEVAREVIAWMERNYAEDAEIMFGDSSYLTPESLALWEEHIPEFVAEMED
jgi:hypothetical protein